MLEANLTSGTVMGLMRWKAEWVSSAGKQRVTAGFLCSRKGYCSSNSLRQYSARTLGAWDLFAYVLLPWERHSHLSCHLHR